MRFDSIRPAKLVRHCEHSRTFACHRRSGKDEHARDGPHLIKQWSVKVIAVLILGVSPARASQISAIPRGPDYLVTIKSDEFTGLCYSPQSFVPNGNFVIDGLPKRDLVIFKRLAPHAAERDDLHRILSEKRLKISRSSIQLNVPRQNVISTPFYIQLLLFACNTDVHRRGKQPKLFALNAVINLKPYPHPPSR
jgi:hypothetical protein